MDLIFFILVFLPEIAWYVYGNTFIYSSSYTEEVGMAQNDITKNEFYTLYVSTLVCIIIGYCYMVLFILMIISYTYAYCVYKRSVQEDAFKPQTDNFKDIPLLGFIENR